MPSVLSVALRRLPLLAILLCATTGPAAALTLTMRSGNAPAGSADPLISRFDLASTCGVGYPTAFTAAEFAAADAGPAAVVLSYIHPAWITGIACDPAARWIGVSALADPLSALFAMDFTLPDPCCFTAATLDFCWSSDDGLGDATNPPGLYVNGSPIAAVAGGSFGGQSIVSGIDVTGLVHCGKNTLYMYDRDSGCAVSGLIFSATLHVEECIVPVKPATWGAMKSLYR